MTVVEEEVFGENFQFVVDLKQMHQDLLLQRRPARASMGSQELLGNAMASPGRLGRPRAGRIDEVPKRGRPLASHETDASQPGGMLGSKNATCSHDVAPRSSKYITNAALGPSGEVADGPTASPFHCRGLSAAQQVSAMGPSTSRFAGPWSSLTCSWCVRSIGDVYRRPGPRDRRQQQEGQMLLCGPCWFNNEGSTSSATEATAPDR